MASRPAFIITTLAEYQTRFWIEVARHLQLAGVDTLFVSFDDRSSEMIALSGFSLVASNEIPRLSAGEQAEVFARTRVGRLNFWTSHERFAFGRTDTAAMHEKFARSIIAAEKAIERGRRDHTEVAMVQEIGGFLSVLGCYFATLAHGVDHWFIEPSFFRGRMIFRRNSISAPQFNDYTANPDNELLRYLDSTVAAGLLVIPQKDAHQYRSALKKVMSRKNMIRLMEKLRDKYLLGKQQEFGFIGKHVGVHLKMLANSRRLRGHYTPLESLGRFIYYPLHVPGDMALTLRSPEYLDQMALIDFLCRTLPNGYKLALKEHPAMVGAISAGRLIELLNRYDNLALLPPTTNNYAVMRQATCIVTVNSKSGGEAGLLGKRVFVLGDAFYRKAPFAIPVERLADLPDMLERELSDAGPDHEPPAHADWFARVWEQSLPGELYALSEMDVREFANSLLQIRRGANASFADDQVFMRNAGTA